MANSFSIIIVGDIGTELTFYGPVPDHNAEEAAADIARGHEGESVRIAPLKPCDGMADVTLPGLTMDFIKGLTDWQHALRTRSVYAITKNGQTFRITNVGRTLLRLMRNNGQTFLAEPEEITEIRGL